MSTVSTSSGDIAPSIPLDAIELPAIGGSNGAARPSFSLSPPVSVGGVVLEL